MAAANKPKPYKIDPGRVEELRRYLAEAKEQRTRYTAEVEAAKAALELATKKLSICTDDVSDYVAQLKYTHGVKDVSVE